MSQVEDDFGVAVRRTLSRLIERYPFLTGFSFFVRTTSDHTYYISFMLKGKWYSQMLSMQMAELLMCGVDVYIEDAIKAIVKEAYKDAGAVLIF